jgi:hypothetical protein
VHLFAVEDPFGAEEIISRIDGGLRADAGRAGMDVT